MWPWHSPTEIAKCHHDDRHIDQASRATVSCLYLSCRQLKAELRGSRRLWHSSLAPPLGYTDYADCCLASYSTSALVMQHHKSVRGCSSQVAHGLLVVELLLPGHSVLYPVAAAGPPVQVFPGVLLTRACSCMVTLKTFTKFKQATPCTLCTYSCPSSFA